MAAARVVVDQRPFAQDVGDPVELVLLADRQLDGPERRTEGLPQLLHRAPEVRAGTVLLGHRDDAGDAGGAGVRPRRARSPGHAVDRADDDERDVRHGERGVDGSHEVRVAGCVDESDAVLGVTDGPAQPGEGEAERCAASDLLRFVIADRRSLLDTAHSGYRPSAVQQRLSERRLAASHRTQQCDGAMGGGIRCDRQ